MNSTTITTIEGTFIVPAEKQQDLLCWLKQNAVKAGQQTIREYNSNGSGNTGSDFYTGRTLINE